MPRVLAWCGILLGLLAGCAGLLTGCSGLIEAPSAVREWVEGPERWLLTQDERREVVTLGSRVELELWVEAFWERRNPEPGEPENLRRETFTRRVNDADRLYSERGQRGALTARGRSLILLGPPTVLRRGTRPSPRWSGSDSANPPTGAVVAEEWRYPPQRLPALLVERLAALGETELTLRFVEERGIFQLAQGEAELRLAAESWVVDASITSTHRSPAARVGRDRGRAPGREPKP